MEKLFILLVCYGASAGATVPQNAQQLIDSIFAYAGQKTFLLSYPRSGNTWMRYCLEFTTGRPTFHRFNKTNKRDLPIGWLADFAVDCSMAPIEKVHTRKEIAKSGGDNASDKLILIIRNPKEALSRHGGKDLTLSLLLGQQAQGNADPRIYFDNIALFDEWAPQNRLLIYYEDFLSKPIQTLVKVITFIEEPLDRIDTFIKNYTFHKKKAIALYRESESHGDDLLFHSKLIDAAYRKQIDSWIKELHTEIWCTYLQERYAEENLVYW
jgi:hypothetical protein